MNKRIGMIIATVVALILPVVTGLIIWFTVPKNPPHSCIHMHVDYGISADVPTFDFCVPEFDKANAYELLSGWGYNYSGTKKFGADVICRVYTKQHYAPSSAFPIGIPGHEDYVEPCDGMPADFAHWAVIIMRGQHDKLKPIPWRYTDKKLWDITLLPGDGIGLVFVVNHQLHLPVTKTS